MCIVIQQAQFNVKLPPFYAIQWKNKLISNECIVHYSYCVLFEKKIAWQLYSLHVANQIASSEVQIRQTLTLTFSFLLHQEAYAVGA